MVEINPLGDKILVKPIERKEESPAGIILPETSSEEKPILGEVLAVGDSDLIKVKAGDNVLFAKFSGTEVKFNREEYLILPAGDILATIKL